MPALPDHTVLLNTRTGTCRQQVQMERDQWLEGQEANELTFCVRSQLLEWREQDGEAATEGVQLDLCETIGDGS